jgi:hypothetical protein
VWLWVEQTFFVFNGMNRGETWNELDMEEGMSGTEGVGEGVVLHLHTKQCQVPTTIIQQQQQQQQQQQK